MAFHGLDKLILYPDIMPGSLKEKSFPKFFTSKMAKTEVKIEEPKIEEPKVEEPKPTVQDRKLGMFEFRTKIVWFNAIGFLLMHIAGVYGLYLTTCDVLKGHFGTLLWSK